MTAGPDADRAAELLAAQLDDLARYRHIVEAQRAVLRMGDAGLLEVFANEAQGIVADISSREVQLLAIRAAAQGDGDPRPLAHPISDLHTRVERERAMASAAARDLASQMESEATAITRQIGEISRQLDPGNARYRAPSEPGGPLRVDRTG
jgi:hypothetical protein